MYNIHQLTMAPLNSYHGPQVENHCLKLYGPYINVFISIPFAILFTKFSACMLATKAITISSSKLCI